MGREPSGSRKRHGCLVVFGLGTILLILLGVALGVASRQNRNASFEQRSSIEEIPAEAVAIDAPGRPLRLRLDIHTAGVSIRPDEAGEPIRVEADYDPNLTVLSQHRERTAEADVLTVELRPRGSKLMELLRTKLGGRPAVLRITLPRDVEFQIEGDLSRSFAALELGGLFLSTADLSVKEGGLKVSFMEPLARPMTSLRLSGDRGATSLVGLGNASPRETRVFQHLGFMDLDLRGAWSRDGKVVVIGGAAGGSVWLPENANVIGVEDRIGIQAEPDPELPLPTVELTITEHMGRLIVMD